MRPCLALARSCSWAICEFLSDRGTGRSAWPQSSPVAAQPVFRLLGAKDLGVAEDYHTAKMPPVNSGLLDGQLAWRQHDGGHTDAPNWKYFIVWADRFLHHNRAEERP